MRLTLAGKLTLFTLIAGTSAGGYRLLARNGSLEALIPAAKMKNSVVPGKAELPKLGTAASDSPVTAAALPGSEPGCAELPEVRLLGYAWNAQMGLHFANGGPQAAKNSLMCKYGVNLKFTRQDDNGKLQEALVAFATEASQGVTNPTKGAHFVTVMGDGSATFLKGLNDQLRRLGPEYQAKIVGAAGFSRGEDKFMGPAAWKANPAASRGGVCAGVLRDGDWNIAQKWLSDNGLRTNPDEKTYDPDALNWVSANDYLDAAEKYVTGYSEERPVVRNGKRTGATKRVTVDSVVTWTPGDVNVAQKRGGLVSVVSTREYTAQMPCVVIGIDKWMRANRKTVEGMLGAICEGGEQVRSNPAALRRAAEVSAAVYREQDAGYWERYFRGAQEADRTGQMVDLGGSSVNNLADNVLLFGLTPGSANVFAATYRVFGDIVVAQYPELLPSYPAVEGIVDTSYLKGLQSRNAQAVSAAVTAQKPRFEAAKPMERRISLRRWHIPFETGRASFTGDALKEMERMRRDLLVAGGTLVELHGHTDSQGDPQKNMGLSEARAFAVKSWLERQSPVNFPDGRVRVFAHGQLNPVAPNGTESGRAQNRRVEVVLGTAAGA